MKIKLRDYQLEAADSVDHFWAEGVRRQLLVLPTAAGKTVIFSEVIRRRNNSRSLVLAHRTELIEQAFNKLAMFIPKKHLGIIKAERNDIDAKVIVASVQSLRQDRRLAQFDSRSFDSIIVDEAHHSCAESYKKVLTHLGCFNDDGPLLVGVTATPERGDRQGLGQVFQAITFKRDLLPMILDGWLADLRAVQIKLDVDFNRLHTRAGDFIDSEVSDLLEQADAPKVIVQAYKEHGENRKCLVFASSVILAYQIADELRRGGYSAQAIDGDTDNDVRKETLADFESGKVQILVNCALLTEGYDNASIECLVIAKPTRCRGNFLQMLGRGTRINKNKRDCLILDIVGSSRRFDLMTTANIFDCAPEELSNKTLTQLHRERLEAERGQSEPEIKLVAQTVNLFDRGSLTWLPVSGNRLVLSVGIGMLVIEPCDDGYRLVFTSKGNREILGEALSEDYATGVAEDFARACGADRLVARGAAWRNNPVTPKQLSTLQKLKVRHDSRMTCGQASDLIAVTIAGFQNNACRVY